MNSIRTPPPRTTRDSNRMHLLLHLCGHARISGSEYVYICMYVCMYICIYIFLSLSGGYTCGNRTGRMRTQSGGDLVCTMYVSSYCYKCVLILLYVSSYCYICVRVLLYMCRYTTSGNRPRRMRTQRGGDFGFFVPASILKHVTCGRVWRLFS